MPTNTPSREIPAVIDERRIAWFRLFCRWRAIHFSVGITAIVTSITVTVLASHPIESLDKTWIIIIGLLSSSLSAALTFLAPANNYRAYVQAWRHLDTECLSYQLDPNIPETRLVEAVRKGEEILGKEQS